MGDNHGHDIPNKFFSGELIGLAFSLGPMPIGNPKPFPGEEKLMSHGIMYTESQQLASIGPCLNTVPVDFELLP